MQPTRWLRLAVKRFRMRWGGSSGRVWFLSGRAGTDGVDYGRATQDGRASAVVQACVLWLARTFPEAPIRVSRRTRKGEYEPVPGHRLTELLTTPNEYYSGILLWSATIADWMTRGNAYWAIVRAEAGNVRELWWLPAGQVTPKGSDDGKIYVTHYEYNRGTEVDRLEPDEVVHFRYGLDPADPRLGLSPLGALLREIFTDEEAAAYTATLLRNVGVPGVVISPELDITHEDAQTTKEWVQERFSGSHRGEPMVLPSKTKVDRLSFNPTEMNLKDLRRIPEERVTAIFGLPAVVVGLGAGLDRSTFANFAEARQAAYESNVIPTQRLFAAELQTQLLPLVGNPEVERVDFDLGDVRVLQPDLDLLFERLDRAVRGGWMMPNEARSEVGLDPVPDGDVLYVPTTVTPTDPSELIPPEPEPAPLAEPAPLRALPPPKSRRAAKARGRSSAAGIARLKARYLGPMTRDVHALLQAEQAAALARLGARAKEVTHLGGDEEGAWHTLMERWYVRVLRGVGVLVEDDLGTPIDVPDTVERAYLAEAGANVRGIVETTRAAVQQALLDAHLAGEGVQGAVTRIRDLPAFGTARARVVSRTELAIAANSASVDHYGASGLVTHVTVHDGDQDEPCASANGATWTLEEARANPIAHPQCVRAFSPQVGEPAAEAGAA
jgi:HK97 family phage portal protein